MINKKRVLIVVGAIILLGITIPISLSKLLRADTCFRYPNASECTHSVATPSYKFDTAFTVSGTGTYQCSKSIKLISYTVSSQDGQYYDYQPLDRDEAKLFCHMTSAFEYKGKLTVLQKPEVLELINKYQYRDVRIKALEFQYIEDKEFVHRLLPQFKDKEIGCIIVLETPNEKLVFLEDEELETFELMDYKIFEQNFRNVSEADKALFLGNLQ
jgi:hypothetical protein